MRFAGPKVHRVFNQIRSANLDSKQFELQLDQLSMIEQRQLGRLLLGLEQARDIDGSGEYIRILRRRFRP